MPASRPASYSFRPGSPAADAPVRPEMESSLTAEAAHAAGGFLRLRAISVTLWFVWAVAFQATGKAPPDIKANLPVIGAYLVVALAALLARSTAPFRRHAWFTLPVVDVPFVFLIHLNALRLWEPRYIAGLATAMFVLLVVLSGHALRPAVTITTAALASLAEGALMEAAGLPFARSIGIMLLLTTAALIVLYFPKRLRVLAERAAEQAAVRLNLERYFSPAVARIIAATGADNYEGSQREVTVLFLDMRGFTAMVEKMAGPAVVAFLNTYHDAMVEVVFRHEGTLDKFMGDGLMAYFGAPLDQPDHAARAVRCGLDMLAAIDSLNQQRAEVGDPPIRVGVGVHSGPVIVGHIGSQRFREYAAVGDTVNLAARIETLTKQMGTPMLCSHTTRARAGDQGFEWTPVAPAEVRGRSAPVETFVPRARTSIPA